jgi:hypothetical protein
VENDRKGHLEEEKKEDARRSGQGEGTPIPEKGARSDERYQEGGGTYRLGSRPRGRLGVGETSWRLPPPRGEPPVRAPA